MTSPNETLRQDPPTARQPVPAAAPPPPADRPTRVALVGAGYIADFHLEILAATAGVEVVCICDPAQERARALASKWGVPHALSRVAQLAEFEVDVAHVLAPPDLHVALTRELLELGVGAYVEKPFALSAADARELAELAEARGLPLAVNHNHRFHPAFVRLMERVRAGEIGRVDHVRVTWSVPLMQLDAEQYSAWMFAAPRNIVFEQGPHPASQVLELVGPLVRAEPTVLSTRELLPGQLFHDRWLCAAQGERGTAELHLAFGQGFTRSTIEVLGSDGCLEADLVHDTLTGERKTPWLEFWNSFLASWRRGRAAKRDAWRVLRNYLAFTLGLRERRDCYFVGMRASLRAFHERLRAGGAPPDDARRAARVLEWCEAIARPAAQERAAAPPPPEPGAPRANELAVLGGTGFIGRRVVARLLARGEHVTCVVRRTHALPPVLAEAAREGRLRLVRATLEDADALERALVGCRRVVHLATGGGDTWEEVERSMVNGSLAVARAAARHGAERLLFVSSIAALYTGPDAPRELADSIETDPRPERRAVYARGKIAAEKALRARCAQLELPLVILRPGVVVGAGTPMQHSGLGLWARDNHCVGWGTGEHPLPLVLADDVAEALVRAALHPGDELDGRALNLCARPPLSAREMVGELRAATGRDLHFHARPLGRSQAMEIGKWLVKKAGRRPGAEFPSWHDLKARALVPRFPCRTAREVLGWEPVEEREAFLDAAVRIYGAEPAR